MKNITLIALVAVFSVSCGIGPFKKDSAGDSSKNGLTEQLGVAGNWANDCFNEKGESDREFFDLAGNKVTWQALAYGTENCRMGDDFRVRRSVYNVLSEVVPAGIEGWKTLRIEVVENSLTYKTQESVNWANKKNHYGYSDWQPNVPKDLSDRRRSPEDTTQKTVTKVGETRYIDFKIDGATMTTADYTTGKAEPSTNPQDVFKKR